MKIIVIALMVFATLMSCNNRGPMNFEGGSAAKMEVADVAEEQAAFQLTQNTIVERKLIRNGRLDFITSNVDKTRISVEAICKKYHAYVSTESQHTYNNRLQYHQEIRVPANQFDNILKDIEALGERIESRNVNTEDVTEEFIDVEARLKAKKVLEERYLSLLKQAKTVADIISIESQITNVRSEIESMQGRLNYLHSQVSYSTLTITYYESIGAEFGFGSKFIDSLKNGWDNLLLFLIGITNIWPFILIGAILSWLFLRRLQIKRRQKAAQQVNH